MSSLAVGSPDPRFGVSAQSVTLVGLLEWRARFQAERVAYTFLGEGEAERITWSDLHHKAQLIGRQLVSLNATGKTVLLLYPSDLEYLQIILLGWLMISDKGVSKDAKIFTNSESPGRHRIH